MTRSARGRLLDAIRAKADAEEHCPHWDFGGYDVHDLHDCCRDLERALQELALARLAFERGEFSGEVDELFDWMEEHGQLDLEQQLEAAIEAELGAQGPLVDVPRIIRKEPL